MRGRGRDQAIVQFDGAIGTGNRASGLGIVVRDREGKIREVWTRQCGPMTCNEAEYSALIWALELLKQDPPQEVLFFSDSEIVVNQMRGIFAVRSPALKRLHRRACALADALPRVSYCHIPRERNCLADALAAEALWPDRPWSARDE